MQIKTMGDRIRVYRRAKGVTVRNLAQVIGISQGSLSGIETNKTKPSADTIQSLYLYTDISFHWLMTGEGTMFRGGGGDAGTGIAPCPGPCPGLGQGQQAATVPIEDVPREQLKSWIDEFWSQAGPEGRHWLIYEIKRHFPEFSEYLKKKK